MTFGIAVGMASSVPPHNINNVSSAITGYIKNKNISDQEVLDLLEGPDFPTGNIVINKNELLSAYSTGRGKARLRARYHIEQVKKRTHIVFTEVPYGVKKEALLLKILERVKDKSIVGVDDVWDESTFDIRLVVKISPDSTADQVLAQLFSRTDLETTFSININCLVKGEPKVLSIKEVVKYYYESRVEFLTRKTIFSLEKLIKRIHVLEGLKIAVNNIDEVIKIVRASESPAAAAQALIDRFSISIEQSKAILAIKLDRLTRLEMISLENEIAEKIKEKAELEDILTKEEVRDSILISDILEIAKKYGDPRRTEIAQINIEKAKQEKKEIASSYISISGDYKVLSSFEKPSKTILATSMYTSYLGLKDRVSFLFSDGKIYSPLVEELIKQKNVQYLNPQEKPITVINPNTTDSYFMILTKNGFVKKTLISEYLSFSRISTIGIKLEDGDEVVCGRSVEDGNILLATKDGQVIYFTSSEVPSTGRATKGVKGVTLKDGNSAVYFTEIKDIDSSVLISTNKGHAKITDIKDFPIQRRGGTGVIGQKTSIDNEEISFILPSSEKFLFYYDNKLKLVAASEIPRTLRASTGNRVVKAERVYNIVNVGGAC